jgi:deoxyribodipyrimidine photo-lyase
MIEKDRIQYLNDKRVADRRYVIYWMQASQRAECNQALEYAIMRANKLERPLLVFFGLTDCYPSANERHYAFMLEGIRETAEMLNSRSIKLVVRYRSPELEIAELAREACLIVVDRGYTRIQRYWRKCAAGLIDCPLIQVESDVIVPIETASPKEEYSAASIRGKIQNRLHEYLFPVRQVRLKKESLRLRLDSFDISNIDNALARLEVDRSVKRLINIKGGLSEAKKTLDSFLNHKLKYYGEKKNEPAADGTSRLSPYLHFGQISPLYIALQVLKKRNPGKEEFLEELIIRRELSANFVYYNNQYDSFAGLPEWCRRTLMERAGDKRPYLYGRDQLENGATHDLYWNAAQKEMVMTGRMHGYMRMYWGKKILEWSERPEEAFQIALYLNDKYELDGRDPNGYAGVAWCFGKHDRPWTERPIFGNIRYMNAEGLKRKFDMEKYVMKVEEQWGAR